MASALDEETAGAEAFVHSITRARNRDVVWRGTGQADIICFNSAPDFEGATEDLLCGMPSSGATWSVAGLSRSMVRAMSVQTC